MRHNRQPLRRAADLLRDHVDFMPAAEKPLGVLQRPAFGAAAARIEAFDDQTDFQFIAPLLDFCKSPTQGPPLPLGEGWGEGNPS